jgi:hypothetical protein
MSIHKKKHQSFLMAFLVAMALVLPACDHSYLEIDELPDYNYGPVMAFPLVQSTLTIDDLIGDEHGDAIFYGDDNLVILVYQDEVFSAYAHQLFSIPDQEFQKSFTINPGGKSSLETFSETFMVNVSGNERLDSVAFKEGTLLFQASAPQLQNDGFGLDAVITFTDSYNQQGMPLSFTASLGSQVSVDLAGYTFVLYSEGEQHNLVDVEYTLNVTGSGNPQNAPYDISLNHFMVDMEFERMFGFIDQRQLPLGSGYVNMGVFGNFTDGDVIFQEPYVNIKAKNSFGIPIDLLVNALEAVGDNGNIPITGYPVPISLEAPSFSQIGETLATEFSLSAANSNISDVMAETPDEIFYDFVSVLNPEEIPNKFILDESRFSVKVEVELPLYGLMKGASLKDTLDLDLEDRSNDVEWVELNIDIMNGLPLDARLQVIFLDENDQFVMELFEGVEYESVVVSGEVDSQGVVTQPGHKNTKILLEGARVEQFFNATRIVLSAQLNTANQGEVPVKIFSDQELDLSIGARVKFNQVVSFGDN